MAHSKIWHNEKFWFRLSLLVVAAWLIFSMLLSMIIYLSWVYHYEGFKELLAEFSAWFFLLPAVTFFGMLNAVPFVAPWLIAALEEGKDATGGENHDAFLQASYSNMTDKLHEDLE